MGRWQSIDVTDALELLSPVFESEEVSIQDVGFLYVQCVQYTVNSLLKCQCKTNLY